MYDALGDGPWGGGWVSNVRTEFPLWRECQQGPKDATKGDAYRWRFPELGPSSAGYSFVGWALDSDFGPLTDFARRSGANRCALRTSRIDCRAIDFHLHCLLHM